MGLRGPSREKCLALIYLLHLERKPESKPFLELVKHLGLSLTLEDAQDEVCARIAKEGEEYMRIEDGYWPYWYLKMEGHEIPRRNWPYWFLLAEQSEIREIGR